MSPGAYHRSLPAVQSKVLRLPTVTQSGDLEVSIGSRTLPGLLRLTCITSTGIILKIEYNNFYIFSNREVPMHKDYGR